MRTLFHLLLILPIGLTSYAAPPEGVQAILNRHFSAMVSDLQAYIEANPGAEDLRAAYEGGIQAAYMSDNTEALQGFLKGQFSLLKTEKPLDVQAVGRTAMLYAQVATEAGNKDDLRSFVEELKTLGESSGNEVISQIVSRVESSLNKPGVGDVMEISGISTTGEKVDLADMSGKVVLVDFWATWCGPCVAEMPNVKAAYAEWHDKGFEIIGISLDRTLDPLKNYMKEQDIAWANLWDPGQRTSMADKYGISSIPSMFLIGPDGKVAAINTRGPALQAKLAELLGK